MTVYRAYLRVSKKGLMSVSKKPNYKPLPDNNYSRPQPTVLVALDLNIPDAEFNPSRLLMALDIDSPESAVEVKQVKQGGNNVQ